VPFLGRMRVVRGLGVRVSADGNRSGGGEGLGEGAVEDVEGVDAGDEGPEWRTCGDGGLVLVFRGESGLGAGDMHCMVILRGPFARWGCTSASLNVLDWSGENVDNGSASRSCGFRTGAG